MNTMTIAKHEPTRQIERLKGRLDKNTKGRAASRNLAAFRKVVAESPEAMPDEFRAATSAMIALIDNVTVSGGSRACMIADTDMIRMEFGYSEAPAMERVLIDVIVAARLRLAVIEHGVCAGGFTLNKAERWEDLLTSAQNRLLRAVESLARVRRLARNTPTIQLNLAGHGGQQVNSIG